MVYVENLTVNVTRDGRASHRESFVSIVCEGRRQQEQRMMIYRGIETEGGGVIITPFAALSKD